MVMIACKAPGGVVLNLDAYEAIGNGNIRRIPGGVATVTLKGWSRAWGTADHTEGGYALTPVPKDFWDAWLASHADFPMLADKTILPPHKAAADQAQAHAAVPQMFAPATPKDVPGIAKAEVA